MKTPGISFVIPVYNMERYLPRVIQCLKAQTMPGFEAIFVNDLRSVRALRQRIRGFGSSISPTKVWQRRGMQRWMRRGANMSVFWTRTTGWSLTWRRCYMRLQKRKTQIS